MWVFGYGSLMWKTDFPYDQKLIGYIKGFKRRFLMDSVVHRGSPGKPGRVVTVIPDEAGVVWGVAYRILQNHAKNVKNQLDVRERSYCMITTKFYPRSKDVSPFFSMLYVASSDVNPNYGPDDDEEIAKIIKASVGMSGRNSDYLFSLAKFVRENIPEDNDAHLFTLEKLVKQSR